MSSAPPPVRRFVFVSDFHMAGGRDERGHLERYEAFPEDDFFAAFLGFVAERATATEEACTVIVLGDFLDFLHTLPPPGAAAGNVTLAKLDRIARGHRSVFSALREFSRRPNSSIAIVPGNHDIELLDAAVQRRFVELLAGDGNYGLSGIVFHPWMYYVPGVLYAEHGSQYHDINAFPALLRAGADESLGAVPLGSHLSRYAVDLLESLGAGDERPPELGRALRALSAMPRGALRTAPLHARLFTAAAVGSLPVGSRSPRARARYRGETLRGYAAEIGLPAETVEAIDRRAATSPWSPYRRTLRALAARVSARAGARARSQAPAYYLHCACGAVDALLAQAGLAVPFYLFGHTHRAERVAIRPGGPIYLNAGTWSSMLPSDLRAFGPGGRLTFVDVEVVDGQEPRAELLRWDSEARRSVVPAGGEDACGGRRWPGDRDSRRSGIRQAGAP
jgi:UDP-2,3-diacylglucosamine pyrophosphatase LpxH